MSPLLLAMEFGNVQKKTSFNLVDPTYRIDESITAPPIAWTCTVLENALKNINLEFCFVFLIIF